ncbi:MAG TPA: PilZ domain-containing protein [Steroidobacteraceae bacterium]
MTMPARQLNRIEHRWGERFPVDLPVKVSVHTFKRIDGRLKNLSLSGALIRADVDIRLHALIEISVALPSPASHEVIIMAHVTRRHNEEVGIEWCDYGSSPVKELLWSHRVDASVGLARHPDD